MTFDNARYELARLRPTGGETPEGATARAAELSSRTLGVRRVGVWTFDRRGQALRCACLYDEVGGHSTPGDSLGLAELAPYAAALEGARVLAADDARAHPALRGWVEGYLAPHGVGARLDAPIYRGGELIGVVTHEHVGEPRRWTAAESDFACAVADALGSLAEQAGRLEVLAALREHQRFESLGRLAAGVAHDFQNLLSVVLIHAARIHSRPDEVATARDSSQEIRDAAEEGVRLTRRLQSFAEPSTSRPKPLSLGDAAARLEPIFRLVARGATLLEVRRETADDTVSAEPSQLDGMLLALVTSAHEALGEHGGAISITVRAPSAAERPSGPACVALEVGFEPRRSPDDAYEVVGEPLPKPPSSEADGVGMVLVREVVERAGGTLSAAARREVGGARVVLWPLLR